MITYKFFLNLRDTPERYCFPLELTPVQEDNPEGIFTVSVRQAIQKKFQEDSSCAVRDNHLNQIINAWIEDIREGYRESSITLDLPLLIDCNIELIEETGNQELPSLFLPDLADIEPMMGVLPPLDLIFSA
jgi:hypothetical protein